LTFVLTNVSGTKHYWHHLLTAPGTPGFVKPILIPLEIFGLFTKPFALMVRLFANISAGHIIVLSLTALVFVFGNLGESLPGSLAGAAVAIPFTLFMGLIELLVAFLQAFIFTMLSALFIGMALDEGHH
jgi:F-type H+-transporting ATPase subunit a